MSKIIEKRYLKNKYFGRGPVEFMNSLMDSLTKKETKEVIFIIDKLIEKFTVNNKFDNKACVNKIIKIINKKKEKKMFKKEHADIFEKDLENAQNEEQRKAVLFLIIAPFFSEKFFSK